MVLISLLFGDRLSEFNLFYFFHDQPHDMNPYNLIVGRKIGIFI